MSTNDFIFIAAVLMTCCVGVAGFITLIRKDMSDVFGTLKILHDPDQGSPHLFLEIDPGKLHDLDRQKYIVLAVKKLNK